MAKLLTEQGWEIKELFLAKKYIYKIGLTMPAWLANHNTGFA